MISTEIQYHCIFYAKLAWKPPKPQHKPFPEDASSTTIGMQRYRECKEDFNWSKLPERDAREYSKEFKLPFTPSKGLQIFDTVGVLFPEKLPVEEVSYDLARNLFHVNFTKLYQVETIHEYLEEVEKWTSLAWMRMDEGEAT